MEDIITHPGVISRYFEGSGYIKNGWKRYEFSLDTVKEGIPEVNDNVEYQLNENNRIVAVWLLKCFEEIATPNNLFDSMAPVKPVSNQNSVYCRNVPLAGSSSPQRNFSKDISDDEDQFHKSVRERKSYFEGQTEASHFHSNSKSHYPHQQDPQKITRSIPLDEKCLTSNARSKPQLPPKPVISPPLPPPRTKVPSRLSTTTRNISPEQTIGSVIKPVQPAAPKTAPKSSQIFTAYPVPVNRVLKMRPAVQNDVADDRLTVGCERPSITLEAMIRNSVSHENNLKDYGSGRPPVSKEKRPIFQSEISDVDGRNNLGEENNSSASSKDTAENVHFQSNCNKMNLFSGVVCKLLSQKKFGFIKPDTVPDDIFFHFDQVLSQTPQLDDRVQFTLYQSQKDGRVSARNVSILERKSVQDNEEPQEKSEAGLLTKEKENIETRIENRMPVPFSNPNVSPVIPGHQGNNKLTAKRTKQTYEGRIKFITKDKEKNFGFIIPDTAESSCDSVKDVFFHVDKMLSNHLSVKKDDTVQYNLYTGKKDEKVSAVKVIPINLVKRSNQEIVNYLEDITFEISDENESRTRIQKQQYLSELLFSTVVWKEIANTATRFSNDERLVNKLLFVLTLIDKNSNTLEQRLKEVIKAICETKFFNPFQGRLKAFIADNIDDTSVQLIGDFFKMTAKHVPEKLQAIVGLLRPLATQVNLTDLLYDLLRISTKEIASYICDVSWVDLPLILTNEEMASSMVTDEISLQKVKAQGPYNSPEDYMDIYFRLLRHDCFAKLKEGISNLLKGKLDVRDMNVYRNVTLVGIDVVKDCVNIALKIESCKRIKHWETSPNLMYGNLLCLSLNGSFQTPIWLTVVDRQMLKKDNVVLVQTCSEHNHLSDGEILMNLLTSRGSAIMVESPTYYRAFQPVLKSLQNMIPSEISFIQELVNLQRGPVPEFLCSENTFDASLVFKQTAEKRVRLQEFLDNPYNDTNSIFDESQERAVKTALQNRIGIIQGPPGCGKSFIGVQMLRLLLSLSGLESPKVLVLTYKNHALDEFLKSALNFFPAEEVVRIGGRSRDPVLHQISLNAKKKAGSRNSNIRDQIYVLEEEINTIKNEIVEQFKALNEFIYIPNDVIIKRLSSEQKMILVSKCQWDLTSQKSLVTIKDEDGFEMKRGPKSKKIAQIEVDFILKNVLVGALEDKFEILVNTAFSQWIPDKKAFSEYEANLVGRNNQVKIQKEQKDKEKKTEKETYEIDDEKDIDEIQQERLSAVTKEMKDDVAKRLIRCTYDDTNTDEKMIKSFSNSALSKISKSEASIYSSMEDLWELCEEERILIVQHIISNEKENLTKEFHELMKSYEERCKERTELENQETSAALEKIKIIGLTITGASIHQLLLKEIRPQIVIVEEAAEVLEPQLVACIGMWTEYMLLIGDHKQLRPPVETYKLRKDYYFDVSMMERLIKNNMPFETLQMQNRQRPEFAELLLDIYPDLKTNMERVANNDPAKCLAKSFQFWHHVVPENKERSVTNDEEAKRAAKLALFLVQQGYDADRITILATYQGQTALIRSTLKKMEEKYKDLLGKNTIAKADKGEDNNQDDVATKAIKVYTVDMYQGDENDFVIVSLVRSNLNNEIGFLKELNRRCVAQSRAKCGLYFIGNSHMFCTHATWYPLIEKLRDDERISDSIEVKCKHHDKIYQIQDADRFTLQNFCGKQCVKTNRCGKHRCQAPCQPPHSHKKCPVKVRFVYSICGHTDQRLCEDDERQMQCKTEIRVNFPCGHGGKKLCFEDERSLKCEFLETIEANCGHNVKKKCSQNIEDIKCKEKCARGMDKCKHPCNHFCHEHHTVKKCDQCEKIKEAEEKRKREEEEKIRQAQLKLVRDEIEKIEKRKENMVTRKEILPEGETATEYFDVKDQVTKFIQTFHHWYPTITKIERVRNDNLKLRWLKAKGEMFDPEMTSKFKFHGTSEEGVKGITENGFRLPQPNSANPPMYGYGIYFASDSSKSARTIYTKGSNMLLLCDVLLGKSWTVTNAQPQMKLKILKEKKCDSLFAARDTNGKGGVRFDEFVVFNPDQAFPKYVIHYAQTRFNVPNLSLKTEFRKDFRSCKKDIFPKRTAKVDDPLDHHFRIAESQFYRLRGRLPRQNSNVKINKVEFFMDPDLQRKFETKQKEFEKKYGPADAKAEYIFGFHGTKDAGIVEKIMNNNFRKSTQGKFGGGVYFSEIPEYTFGYGGEKHLILAKVLPGRTKDCAIGGWSACGVTAGYDSHGGFPMTDGRFKEIVIFDVDQILPCYVIHLVN